MKIIDCLWIGLLFVLYFWGAVNSDRFATLERQIEQLEQRAELKVNRTEMDECRSALDREALQRSEADNAGMQRLESVMTVINSMRTVEENDHSKISETLAWCTEELLKLVDDFWELKRSVRYMEQQLGD